MRVLVTGHAGYIGSVLAPFVRGSGHDVVGLDTYLYEGCTLGPEPPPIPALSLDIRDVEVRHLRGFDAIVHLAALSNDPVGHLDPARTYEINHRAAVYLGRLAKGAGVRRFVFASSCSLYGAASPSDLLGEDAPLRAITPYGESKVLAERDLSETANGHFSPIYLRNATVYGHSPRLRLDLVVNDFVASAFTDGKIRIESDGTPWRPLVHVEDVAQATVAALEAPTEAIHDQAFNIGQTTENYQVSQIADIVARAVPGSSVVFAEGGGPDARCYRVDFSKAERNLPGFRPRWTLLDGIRQLVGAYSRFGLTQNDLARFIRLRRIQALR
ncbi:MAG: NAD-dependent epimerase/dehydratase family protein, partial [Vicinamibacterales bacterium]